jgi:Spy/CpxP family protein refolding chaperone
LKDLQQNNTWKEDKKMTKKKKIVIGALVLSLAVAAGIGAVAVRGPNGAWGKAFHPGFHRTGFHHGLHSEDVADFVIWKMDKHMKELNLNEPQKQEYEKAKEEIRKSIADVVSRRMEFHGIVRDEMSRENPDVNSLGSLVKERANHIPDMVSKHVDLFLNLYNMLDEDQKARVIEMFRSRMDL